MLLHAALNTSCVAYDHCRMPRCAHELHPDLARQRAAMALRTHPRHVYMPTFVQALELSYITPANLKQIHELAIEGHRAFPPRNAPPARLIIANIHSRIARVFPLRRKPIVTRGSVSGRRVSYRGSCGRSSQRRRSSDEVKLPCAKALSPVSKFELH